ncbi:hypothetical protein ACN93_00715 [Gordonia paraffinivorans]|uniref:Z1 domain-containing protein n=1 Tax=Gordonia paraffinivorans TaxID=175628 RepID=UPI000D6127CB|nr:Z1 domain-containing protein [Gordonia paraffinivorans]PWD44975.1 hypothetical protein ACN93_00715 [Gordonia paraffinivorans]
MDQNFVRQSLIDRMRRHGETVDQAAEWFAQGLGVPLKEFAEAIEGIRRDGRRNMLLDSPPGVYDTGLEAEARMAGWYTGPEAGDEIWPRLRERLEESGMRDVVDEIDKASTKVVAHLADPHVQNLSKRGLVLGYVQSGKTANYTAVMAKAADAGYCLFIVLSGLHNNLRRQTQVRLDNDIVDHDWVALTSETADFGHIVNGAAFLNGRVKSIAVVKKNQARLRRLRDWLREIPISIRRRTPILLLDDEADQATPNSATAADQLSKINELIREIWAEIPTGTYLGYTATPFANVFMDPNDDEELYPADFIIDLPRPEAYFGAERVFGREPLDDADDPDPGLDVIRDIPEEDAALIRPPSSKEAREEFDPEIPPSLDDAIIWFIVASAIRRARGQVSKHSSMLIHTTHYIQPHFAMRDRVNSRLAKFRAELRKSDFARFRKSFETEARRASGVATLPLPTWDALEPFVIAASSDVRVVVDNGESEDRLDYTSKNGEPETVIAIGGGTLSRGLTLEGLVVSYFTRTSNTYDTLLQMGRWFGYRPGYEDLPRIWMQPSLADEFRFLALVEEEIRRDIADMEKQQVTPKELGLRVRAHPGRLAIVARNKMRHASKVEVSFSGVRLQTFIFAEKDADTIRMNRAAIEALVRAVSESSSWSRAKSLPRWIASDVSPSAVLDLLASYQFHPNQTGMRADHMIDWIKRAAPENLWNIVIIGSNARHRDESGEPIRLGEVNVGLPEPIPCVNRAPLAYPGADTGVANVKALMSHADWFVDLSDIRKIPREQLKDPRAVRRAHAAGRGLVVVYPVSKDSIPLGSSKSAQSRRSMCAPDHVFGIGLVFPEVETPGLASHGTYLSVQPDWSWEAKDADDEFPTDNEGSLEVDGEMAVKDL